MKKNIKKYEIDTNSRLGLGLVMAIKKNKEIRQLEKEIERLNKKIDYLEELDRKHFLQVLTLQNKIFDYERGIK